MYTLICMYILALVFFSQKKKEKKKKVFTLYVSPIYKLPFYFIFLNLWVPFLLIRNKGATLTTKCK